MRAFPARPKLRLRGWRPACVLRGVGLSDKATTTDESPAESSSDNKPDVDKPKKPVEIGGRKGPEPTRYGDWEVKGICTDF